MHGWLGNKLHHIEGLQGRISDLLYTFFSGYILQQVMLTNQLT